MILLRNFADDDAIEFQQKHNAKMSIDEVKILITKWQEKEFANKYFEMFAIIKDNEIVGMISLYQHSATVISCGPEIFERYRKQGIGQALVQGLVNHLQQNNVIALLLEVRVSNHPAISLYEKLGFVQVGRRPKYYHNPREDALILRKEL